MKTIGLLGGMSWESSAEYYRDINHGVKQALGGLHSAKIILYSVDFAEIEQLQQQEDWAKAANSVWYTSGLPHSNQFHEAMYAQELTTGQAKAMENYFTTLIAETE